MLPLPLGSVFSPGMYVVLRSRGISLECIRRERCSETNTEEPESAIFYILTLTPSADLPLRLCSSNLGVEQETRTKSKNREELKCLCATDE